MTESPLMDTSFAVPVFSPGDDPIAYLNKAMAFLTAVSSSRFPSTNNQLRTSSNPRNQATIQDGKGNNASGQARVVKCYNCQCEGHMARQCTQPKRPRNATWYKKKAMLAEAQEARQILDEEQLTFLADLGVPDGQAVRIIIPNNAAFQTEDLDTYDSDCEDLSNAQAVLMANISNYGSDVISEVPHFETYLNDMENQSVHVMQDFEQPPAVDFSDNEIHSDSNIIPYSQYFSREKMIDSQMDAMIKEKLALKEQVDSLKQNLSKQIKENECLLQTFTIFKSESKEKEDKYMENEIDLEKKIKELDNILFKIIPTLYDGIVISDKHVAIPVIDDEKTLILEENNFGKRFTPQQEMDAEQALWLRISNPTSKPSDASPVKIEAHKELHKVSLVNESLKKLKFHLARFDNVVKIRTTPDARTEEFFEKNDLKAQLQDKDTTICKLKDMIKSMREKSKEENVKYDYGEIETKNVELENSMFKLDLEPLAPRLLQNRDVHIKYLKYAKELADILRGIVKQAKVKQTLDKDLDFSRKHAQRIQELLVYVRDTCPNAINDSAKKVAVTPKNKVKKVRFTSANVVPPKKTIFHSVETQKPELKVYSRKPKNVKNIGSSKKTKIVESKNANHSEPNHTWGSNATDIPSSSSLVMIGCPDCSLVSGLWMFETHDREPLSAHELYNGTKFVNQTLREFYENVGISHQTSVARTPQQNDVVERQN
ncbi:retrovirus-related pol polyprotein from transposon TNT 1-94 [Tanacetum coccineum]